MKDVNIDKIIADLIGTFELMEILGDPEQFKQYESYLKQRREARRARHEAKVAVLFSRLTDKAEALIAAYEREGAKVNKFFTDHSSGNVAVMMVGRQVWDQRKQRTVKPLIMVYPDGTRTTTNERSVTLKRHF